MALCAGFSMPLGRERQYRTTYADLKGLRASFPAAGGVRVPFPGVQASAPAVAPDAAPLQVLAENRSASETSASSAPPASRDADRARPGRRPVRNGKAKRGSHGTADGVALSTSTVPQPDRTPIASSSPIEGVPQPAARPVSAELGDSPEALRDAFEADVSKFPLDANESAAGVVLRLVGLCRARGRYVMKVAVTNRGVADFFVKELAAYSGEDVVSVRSYMRLFIEPGRTREGYVVFTPQPGAQVKIKLKEDGEKGRVLKIPVRYPF